MPNRVIREGFLDSDKINALDAETQCFFIRLMLIADDYGCFDARPTWLRSRCYPVSDTCPSIVRQMTVTCQSSGLIQLYNSGGKDYGQIVNFNQRLRQKRSKYPLPENSSDNCQSIDGQLSVNCTQLSDSDSDSFPFVSDRDSDSRPDSYKNVHPEILKKMKAKGKA